MQLRLSMQDAFKAHTVNAAFQMRRDHDLGSITVGKLADLVKLSADPFTANPETLTDEVKVLGTWSNGRKVDTAAFLSAVEALDPTPHAAVEATATSRCC